MNQPQASQRTRRQQNPPPATNGGAVVNKEHGQNPLAEAGFDPSKPLIFQTMANPELRKTVQWICQSFADSPTSPPHVRGNPGIVLTALDMALATSLHPLYIMNCMFDRGNGRLGMMAELVLAALRAKRLIKTDPVWEHIGDWDSQVQGKFAMVDGKKGKYAKATYTRKDEEGLGVKVTIHWKDEPKPITYGPYWLADQHPRFSTMWATDARQQMHNKVLRKVTREVRPDLLNAMPVDEEADPQYYGPDNAKELNPKESLDGFAEQQAAKRGGRSKARTVEGSAAKAEPAPQERKRRQDPSPDDDGPPPGLWPDDDPDGRGSAPCGPDQATPDDEPPAEEDDGMCAIWLNPENPEYRIARGKFMEVFSEAMYRTTSIDAAMDLFNNNGPIIRSLPDGDRAKINKLLDERERVLKE